MLIGCGRRSLVHHCTPRVNWTLKIELPERHLVSTTSKTDTKKLPREMFLVLDEQKMSEQEVPLPPQPSPNEIIHRHTIDFTTINPTLKMLMRGLVPPALFIFTVRHSTTSGDHERFYLPSIGFAVMCFLGLASL